MDLTVVTKPGMEGKALEVEGLVSKHLSKKLEKIEQRWGKPVVARAVLEELPIGFEATVTLAGKDEFVGRGREEDLVKAVDAALLRLARQVDTRLEKRKTKAQGRRASGVIKAAKPF